jgi:hypothetical protein
VAALENLKIDSSKDLSNEHAIEPNSTLKQTCTYRSEQYPCSALPRSCRLRFLFSAWISQFSLNDHVELDSHDVVGAFEVDVPAPQLDKMETSGIITNVAEVHTVLYHEE